MKRRKVKCRSFDSSPPWGLAQMAMERIVLSPRLKIETWAPSSRAHPRSENPDLGHQSRRIESGEWRLCYPRSENTRRGHPVRVRIESGEWRFVRSHPKNSSLASSFRMGTKLVRVGARKQPQIFDSVVRRWTTSAQDDSLNVAESGVLPASQAR